MSLKIFQLPAHIANQIAAGEVIERPASVIKELLENSYDAGASKISIDVAFGGLNQIKIADNGHGIHAEDLPLAIAAHATSKIKTVADLYTVQSMGFRGEALASIVSIAKVSISSKPADQEIAAQINARDTQYELSTCARNNGTTIVVEDLFYNTPVRKKFLKSPKLEFQAIEAVVKCFALSAPHVQLTLKHNDKVILQLPAANDEFMLMNRLAKLFGKPFIKAANRISEQSGSMSLKGWVSNFEYQRSQNDRQWIYVNQRMVKDKLLTHALRQACEEWLHPGRFPCCVLYLQIPLADVDVNVHPTKHELRFQEPRLVHGFVSSTIRAAVCSPHTMKEEILIPSYQKPIQLEIQESSLFANQLKRQLPIENRSWIALNDNYILLNVESYNYLIHFKKLYELFLNNLVLATAIPLAQRPLLVPFRWTKPKNLKLCSAQFNDIGINVENENQELVIQSIPVLFPNLDIAAFFESLSFYQNFNLNDMLQLLVQSQRISPSQLTAEERLEIIEFFERIVQQNLRKKGLYKLLTESDCRDLLNV